MQAYEFWCLCAIGRGLTVSYGKATLRLAYQTLRRSGLLLTLPKG